MSVRAKKPTWKEATAAQGNKNPMYTLEITSNDEEEEEKKEYKYERIGSKSAINQIEGARECKCAWAQAHSRTQNE